MICPNCVTEWKCNGPHLIHNNGYYTSADGYFLKELNEWIFLPKEKIFNSQQLLDILNTLSILNDKDEIVDNKDHDAIL